MCPAPGTGLEVGGGTQPISFPICKSRCVKECAQGSLPTLVGLLFFSIVTFWKGKSPRESQVKGPSRVDEQGRACWGVLLDHCLQEQYASPGQGTSWTASALPGGCAGGQETPWHGPAGSKAVQGDASRRCVGLPNGRSRALPGCDNSLLSTLGCAAWFAAAISLHPKGCSP